MIPTWTVKHSASGYPSTPIGNVQTVNIRWGRTEVTDTLQSGSYTVTGRRPDLLPSIQVGDRIEIMADQGSSPLNFYALCRVADFRINYGIVSNMDTWTLVCEDAHAILGRSQITTNWTAGDIEPRVQTVTSTAGITYDYSALAQVPTQISAVSTVTGRALDIVQQMYNSYVPNQWVAQDVKILATYGGFSVNTFYATDSTSPPAQYLKYNELQFSGLALNYSPYAVSTSPANGSISAGTGTRAYTFSTYNNLSSEQSSVTQRMAALLSSTGAVPTQISYTASQQAAATRPFQWDMDWVMGNDVLVISFRGTTYNTVVIGGSVSATPEDTRITLNILPTAWVSAFRLDSAAQGVLDTNRLG